MTKFVAAVKMFVRDEDGPTAVEYALLMLLIAVLIVVSVTLFGLTVSGIFEDFVDKLFD